MTFMIAVNFNPLPSCEGRLIVIGVNATMLAFQSTPLMRGETRLQVTAIILHKISIHSPHARGDVSNGVSNIYIEISIHSPHARGDTTAGTPLATSSYFNPLPSCEGRPSTMIYSTTTCGFQSTPLMRGETGSCPASRKTQKISIHSPHARGDTGCG